MKKRKGLAAMTAAKRKAISAAGGRAKARKQAVARVGCPGCREAESEHDDSCKAWPKAWV